MMRARKLTMTGLATLGALAGGLFLFAAPALAGTGHGFSGSFGSAASTPSNPFPLSSPAGVAVNQSSKDVYVVDKGNNRVEYFSSAGSYIGQFNGSGADLAVEGSAAPTGQFSSPEGIAVDNDPSSLSFEDVYIVDTGHNVIDKFSKTGHYESQLTGSPTGAGGSLVSFSNLGGLAVDGSGNVWVYEMEPSEPHWVYEFNATGGYVSRFQDEFGTTPGLAVDASNVYVDRGSGAPAVFTRAGEYITSIENPKPATGLASDPPHNELYIDQGTSVAEYDTSAVTLTSPGTLIQEFASGTLAGGGGAGIAVDSTSGNVYVADAASSEVDIFTLGSTPPVPNTDPPGSITATTATLNGDLNPGGSPTDYYFSYNQGASCTGPGATKTPLDPPGGPGNPATGSIDIPESAQITGLEPNTQYSFCFVSENNFGSTFGPSVPLKTHAEAPTIVTGSERAENVTPFQEALEAQLNPDNQATTCEFQYVDEATFNATGYTGVTPVPCAQPSFEGFTDQTASVSLSGLSEDTTYHYRILATNATGTSAGEGVPFTTFSVQAPTLTGLVSSNAGQPVGQTSVSFSAQVNPNFGETECHFQYVEQSTFEKTGFSGAVGSVACQPAPGAGEGAVAVSANVSGLTAGTIYHYRVLASNAKGANEEASVFSTLQPAPAVSTGGSSAITLSAATVTGTVNPEGLETHYWYEYGPTAGYGQTEPVPPGVDIGSGSTAEPVPLTLFPLTAGTTYHYRLVAENEAGVSYGQDETFTTLAYPPPLASTGGVSAISQSTATITGTINPEGTQTTYEFDLGETAGSYSTHVYGAASPEQGTQTVTLALQNLQPATTYHYRILASNKGGTSEGADQTFTTAPATTPITAPITSPLLATPSIAFPTETGTITKTTTKALTRAQKLAKALKVCKKQPKDKRAGCQKQAHKRYGPAAKKKKK